MEPTTFHGHNNKVAAPFGAANKEMMMNFPTTATKLLSACAKSFEPPTPNPVLCFCLFSAAQPLATTRSRGGRRAQQQSPQVVLATILAATGISDVFGCAQSVSGNIDFARSTWSFVFPHNNSLHFSIVHHQPQDAFQVCCAQADRVHIRCILTWIESVLLVPFLPLEGANLVADRAFRATSLWMPLSDRLRNLPFPQLQPSPPSSSPSSAKTKAKKKRGNKEFVLTSSAVVSDVTKRLLALSSSSDEEEEEEEDDDDENDDDDAAPQLIRISSTALTSQAEMRTLWQAHHQRNQSSSNDDADDDADDAAISLSFDQGEIISLPLTDHQSLLSNNHPGCVLLKSIASFPSAVSLHLSPSSLRIAKGTAGCNSACAQSEAASCELLLRLIGFSLSHTEMEIEYDPLSSCSRLDFLGSSACGVIGVSVTRALYLRNFSHDSHKNGGLGRIKTCGDGGGGKSQELLDFARSLLQRKLQGIDSAAKGIHPLLCFRRAILHVWAPDMAMAEAVCMAGCEVMRERKEGVKGEEEGGAVQTTILVTLATFPCAGVYAGMFG